MAVNPIDLAGRIPDMYRSARTGQGKDLTFWQRRQHPLSGFVDIDQATRAGNDDFCGGGGG